MLKQLRSWLRRPASRPLGSSARLRLEALDARIVPATGVLRNGFGQVVISGSAADDSASVSQSGDDIIVDLNGTTSTFASNRVRGIVFRGGDGNDLFTNNTTLRSQAFGGNGDDSLNGGSGNDNLHGEAGDDSLTGGDGNDNLQGEVGDDSLTGGNGNDMVRGGRGNDSLSGGSGRDMMLGDDGADIEDGDVGDDSLFGGAGDDDLNGDDGNDQMHGGQGNDDLQGDAGNDRLFGEAGDDHSDGGQGSDAVFSGSGHNTSLSDSNDSHDDSHQHDGHLRADGVAVAEGSITAIDAAASQVTIQTRSGASVTITIDPSTVLEKNDAHVTLADFQVGDQVEAKFDPQTFVATKLESSSSDGESDGNDSEQGAEIEGTITAIGTDNVTIQTRRGQSVTITIDAQTRLERNDVHVALSDFQVGDAAEARYDPATLVASKLEAVTV